MAPTLPGVGHGNNDIIPTISATPSPGDLHKSQQLFASCNLLTKKRVMAGIPPQSGEVWRLVTSLGGCWRAAW
jgi:hypothetical protein